MKQNITGVRNIFVMKNIRKNISDIFTEIDYDENVVLEKRQQIQSINCTNAYAFNNTKRPLARKGYVYALVLVCLLFIIQLFIPSTSNEILWQATDIDAVTIELNDFGYGEIRQVYAAYDNGEIIGINRVFITGEGEQEEIINYFTFTDIKYIDECYKNLNCYVKHNDTIIYYGEDIVDSKNIYYFRFEGNGSINCMSVLTVNDNMNYYMDILINTINMEQKIK